ncbi:hypothetical protein E2C01_085604 [Portunus trituberculatus]|uniref:Uncharacterized protein n=1 Tax=Portunus trituberculatus TaxID=210409 RepID=A0A5B7J766_PORTR|nr:hypothetical protein [Portunus trituberculatus]
MEGVDLLLEGVAFLRQVVSAEARKEEEEKEEEEEEEAIRLVRKVLGGKSWIYGRFFFSETIINERMKESARKG